LKKATPGILKETTDINLQLFNFGCNLYKLNMRLTLRFIVKCLVALMFLMFLVPLLFYQLDSEEEKRAEALKKRADEHRQRVVKKVCESVGSVLLHCVSFPLFF